MWCHLHYKNDIFVTSDGNFHKATKLPRLLALGAGQIVRPMRYDTQPFVAPDGLQRGSSTSAGR